MQATINPNEGERIQVPALSATPRRSESSRGKMTIFIRSKRVYVETKVISFPSFVGNFGSGVVHQAKRVAVYEDVLDLEQKEALCNSEALARSLGVKLEVRDIGKSSILTRLADFVRGAKMPSRTPSISVSGPSVTLLVKAPEKEEYPTKLYA